MSKPHIIADYIPDADINAVNYFIYGEKENDVIYLGTTWVNSDGTFYKTERLINWLNNPENVKKYLKTSIK